MIGQEKQSIKGNKRRIYTYISASLSLGIVLGWALGHFINKKAVVTQKKIASERVGSTLNRVRETILAIDNELSTMNNAEDRKVLVEVAYKLRNLELRKQIQDPVNPLALKQTRGWLTLIPDKLFKHDKRFWCTYPNFKG
jgi:hypothetical protein